jgi:hypothetical protein
MDRIREIEGAIERDGKWIFSEGDPSPGGHLPTRITARFLNLIQEELVNAVEGSFQGLDGTKADQLLDALRYFGKFGGFDVIVGDGAGELPSLKEALETVSGQANILINKNIEVIEPLEILVPDLTINAAPGKSIKGSDSLDGPMFRIRSKGISFISGRYGFGEATGSQTAFFAEADAAYVFLDKVRFFGFPRRNGFSGNSQAFMPMGIIYED